MYKICQQFVKNAESSIRRFPLRDFGGITMNADPTVRDIHGAEVEDMLKFFYDSFNHSAGDAKMSKKGLLGKLVNRFNRKDWLIDMRNTFLQKDYVVEAVKDGDKTLGFYFLSKGEGNEACVDFLAINPDIKNSKIGDQTILTLAERILERAKTEGVDVIKWSTDVKNKKAFRLFDKFPAKKETNEKARTFKLFGKVFTLPVKNKNSATDFTVSVPDFEATLNRYM